MEEQWEGSMDGVERRIGYLACQYMMRALRVECFGRVQQGRQSLGARIPNPPSPPGKIPTKFAYKFEHATEGSRGQSFTK